MNLGLCIANLLRRYPAVEVPGIGVFKIVRQSASFDQTRSVLHPPVSRIELTEESTGHSLLLDYLQAQKGVDEATAARMLDQAVTHVKDALTRNGQALLDGLGYLVSEGSSLVFRPFVAEGIENRPLKVPGARTAVDKPVEVAEEKEEAEEEIAAEQPEAEATGGGRTTRWVVAAAVLVLLSAAAAIWVYRPDWITGGQGDRVSSQGAQDTIGSGPSGAGIGALASTADTLSTVDSTALAGAAVADSVRVDTAAAEPEPKRPTVTYEIIVGSFATMAQAEKYVAKMKAKGYDLKAMDSRMPGNRKKISWGSYATEEEAYRELARVKKNFEPGAWIAKIEHD